MVAEVSNATEFIKPITANLTELTRVEMSDEKRFKQSMRKLAARLVEHQDRARSLGVFPGDRELLECSHCGLMEDVLCTGQLITCRSGREGQDTGLRFEELDSDAFRCPACNTVNHGKLG